MIFFLFHIEIEGKGGWIMDYWGCQRVCWPPSQIIGGGGPLPTPMLWDKGGRGQYPERKMLFWMKDRNPTQR